MEARTMVKSKFDTVKEKYFYEPRHKQWKSSLSSFKFRRDSDGQQEKPLHRHETPSKLLATPDTLAFLASIKVDQFKTPQAMFWTLQCVKNFITQLGYPVYTDAFAENLVHGRYLILIDPSNLVKMNITDADHIAVISKEVRKLYELELERFDRSILLPPRYPLTCYKLHGRFTGPKYRCCRASDLFQKMQLIDMSARKEDDHWVQLEKWLKHLPETNIKRIGYAPRYKLYTRRTIALKKLIIKRVNLCDCMPPCECQWTERDTKKPWILAVLLDPKNAKYLGDDPMCGTNKEMAQIVADVNAPCKCLACSGRCTKRKVLTTLKSAIPRKYDTLINVNL